MLSYKYWINIYDKYYLVIADDLSKEEIDTKLAHVKKPLWTNCRSIILWFTYHKMHS